MDLLRDLFSFKRILKAKDSILLQSSLQRFLMPLLWKSILKISK